MELREWIAAEHAAVVARFEQSVVDVVPLEYWRDPVGDGGSSLAWLAFHTAFHEDVAVHGVLGGGEPLLATWRERLGIAGADAHVGLGETEVPGLSAALSLEDVLAYVRAVHDSAASTLDAVAAGDLDRQPDSAAGLAAAGVDAAAVPWLSAMWSGKPASWFVQWEAIGHRVNHLGEMVSVRNRLGLSPF